MYGKELFSVHPDATAENRSAAGGEMAFSGGFPYSGIWRNQWRATQLFFVKSSGSPMAGLGGVDAGLE